MGYCERTTSVPARHQVAWQDMHTSDITDTYPPFLHLTVMPTGSRFDSGHAVACVNALLILLFQWSSQKEVSYLQAGTVMVAIV